MDVEITNVRDCRFVGPGGGVQRVNVRIDNHMGVSFTVTDVNNELLGTLRIPWQHMKRAMTVLDMAEIGRWGCDSGEAATDSNYEGGAD